MDYLLLSNLTLIPIGGNMQFLVTVLAKQQDCKGKHAAIRLSRNMRFLGTFCPSHRIKTHIEGPLTCIGSFEVSVLAHVALRILAAIFLASQ
jgi:hypothetical protein